MRASALASVATLALSASFAPASAQGHNWNGFYVGAHLGSMTLPGANFADVGIPTGAGGTPSFTAAQVRALSGKVSDDTDHMGGAQIGYNWQISPKLVAGLEADISTISRNSERFTNSAFDAGNNVRLYAEITNKNPMEFFGTVRGRFGYLISQPLLLFVTGGLAYAQTNTTASFQTAYPGTVVIANSGTFGGRSMQTGYTVGGGFEYAVDRNVSLKVEGLYYDLGTLTDSVRFNSFNTAAVHISTNTLTKTQDLSGAIARVGVNYKF